MWQLYNLGQKLMSQNIIPCKINEAKLLLNKLIMHIIKWELNKKKNSKTLLEGRGWNYICLVSADNKLLSTQNNTQQDLKRGPNLVQFLGKF